MSVWSPVPPTVRQRIERFAQRSVHLPHGLQKTIAVLAFLTVGLLFLGGGSFVIASLMHAVVTKLDMPPTIQGPIYITGSQVRASTGQGVIIHENAKGQAPATYIVVPRPTLSHSLDHALVTMKNPTGTFVQMDAVDVGLFLQQSVHQWLLGLFSDATRASVPASPAVSIPLTDGQ
ncbi:MAG: hypothetical protein OWT28_06945 [Firmicutes bacterium]|nr:hypothetical protein [Bacillota bacterium]